MFKRALSILALGLTLAVVSAFAEKQGPPGDPNCTLTTCLAVK